MHETMKFWYIFFHPLLKNGRFWSPARVYKVGDRRLHLAGEHLKTVLCLLAAHWNLCRSSQVKVVLICVPSAEISCTHCSAEPCLLSFQSHKGRDDLTIKTATHVTSSSLWAHDTRNLPEFRCTAPFLFGCCWNRSYLIKVYRAKWVTFCCLWPF